ncbi:OB-fold nucleic acid binding domain containing protein [Histomonas meleagridis]|uniref:OB-fold nucleic acid binding domain containing protein n=1 Tax=Histomonas meleagridis TaxID=135588 RepID=UPI00355AA451|nr:OB-fold nucleic acid binding domain containing protein [Histomonas meleagridis]KAH0799012.1 OB-fold nucleic acid binding domain containing protein [Histomonas meleagridis]
MTITNSHLKLTIRDIFSASTAERDEAYFCKQNLNDENNRPIIFINARISGLVIKNNETSFLIDDGTGVICVEVPTDSLLSIPKVGDYIEVLGKISGDVERMIILKCYSTKNDPMEEVKHLLEQAAIHRNNIQFRNESQERFLSSDASISTGFDKISDQVTNLILSCDQPQGVSYEQIKQICGTDEIAKRVISLLENTGIMYSSKGSYYPL